MLEQLFGSKTRLKLLRVFFREPEQSFFVRELSRHVGVQINAIRRELELLLRLDIIQEKEEKRKKEEVAETGEAGATLRRYYQLNPDSIICSELQALLLKDTIIDQKEFIKELEEKTGDIKLLVLTGRFTSAQKAPTDILIVGKIKPRALAKIVEQYEKNLGFDIRYTVMSKDEFTDRRYVMDKFIYGVFEADHLKVVNDLGV
ncbi:MAG TPA: hypothetical protein DCS29_03290 [Candidatus Magasanikbacteria bacterium]|nr:MAG: hypothetical protein A2479_02890 [Candidatus Magasanikbacteria bacterium RIFOXYC2_FULL_39_8]HAT03770.1 hypothetical protein [Candidatus Magasanikbacteria bacterium]